MTIFFKRFFRTNLTGAHLFSSRNAKNFVAHFGGNAGHNFDEKKGGLGYGWLHYALIINLRPKRVLCVGSTKGFIPAICALACKDNNSGKVDFVDAGYDRSDPNHWGGIGFWKQVDPKKHFALYGLDAWLTAYVMTTEQFALKKKGRRWDYIYIDGDHSYAGVRRDYELFWPYLKKGGLMAFHDILLQEHPEHADFGVWRFWKELMREHTISLPYPIYTQTPSGLGLIQKV